MQITRSKLMHVRAVMSAPVIWVTPLCTVRQAAMLMRYHQIGALPVLEEGIPVGLVTDRDIVVRVLSGRGATGVATVGDAMTAGPVACFADQGVVDAAAIMGDLQIRRLLVVERSGELVGILSLGDIAEHASEELAGQALGEVREDRLVSGRDGIR